MEPYRYTTVTRPDGLRDVVRLDGQRVCDLAPPPPAPEPEPPAPPPVDMNAIAAFRAHVRALAARRAAAIPSTSTATTRAPKPKPLDPATVPNGPELRQRREDLGVSQRDLAALVGMARATVHATEIGRRTYVYTRAKLAAVLTRLERDRRPGSGLTAQSG